ncbi:MAG TPA: hypothetical protein VN512_08665 [Clostridia bacterium]|nr:hypothetical protein [Clostridia bacterium]
MSEDYERQISTINTVSDNLTAEQAELQNSIDTGSKVRTTHFCSLQHKFLVT